MRRTRMRNIIALAALLLALVSGAEAYGQKNGDSFISGGDSGGMRWGDLGNGYGGDAGYDGSGTWNGLIGGYGGDAGYDGSGTWNGLIGGYGGDAGYDGSGTWNPLVETDNEAPVGNGLLVLALSVACYVVAKARRVGTGRAEADTD